MPPRVLPQYQLAEVAPRPLPGPYQSGTGLEGAQLARAGAQLQEGADQVARTQLWKAGLDNEARAKDLDNQFSQDVSNLLWDPQNGYFTTKGANAINARGGVKTRIDELRQKYLGMAQNADQTRMITDVLSRRLQLADDQMARHATSQNMVYQDEVSKARLANSANDAALNAGDAKTVQLLYNTGLTEIMAQGQREGWGADVLQAKRREYDTDFHTKQVQKRLADNDPLAADAYFKANKGSIDIAKAATIEAHLKDEVLKRRAQMVDDALTTVATGRVPGGDYGSKVGRSESANSYDPPSTPTSRSTDGRGRYGFLRGGFVPLAREADPQATAGKSDDEIWNMARGKENAALQDKVFSLLTSKNEAQLRAAGVAVNDSTRYLAHWFGAGGAIKILQADPSTPIENFLPNARGADGVQRTPAQWAQVNGLAGKTVGDVINIANKRMADTLTPGLGERKGTATMQQYIDAAMNAAGPDPEMRSRAIDLAMKRYNAITTAAEADERRKRMEEEAQGREADKDLWHAQAGNQLTPAMVEERRKVLSPDNYKALMKAALGQEPMADNKQAYTDFLARLDKESIERDVLKAMANNLLTTTTGRDLIEKNRSYLKDDQPLSPYKSGREFVQKALDPGLMESGAARAMMVAGQARAVAEFDDWAVRNPGKTRDEMMVQARDIAQRYSTVNTMDSALAMPIPRFMATVQTKQQLMNPPDPKATLGELQAAARQVIDRMNTGQMSRTEAANELKAIEFWEGLINKRLSAQPAKK